MYAIISGWMPFETETKTEAPPNHSIKFNKKYSREEEFRSALESYMADYRRNRDSIADKTTHQLQNQISLGRRTAEMLRFQSWF